jgi:WD40 repeat protein
VTGIAFSPDGSQLATVSRDGRLTLWGVETGEIQAQLSPGVGPLTDVAFTPDGARLAASTADGRVLVWDVLP